MYIIYIVHFALGIDSITFFLHMVAITQEHSVGQNLYLAISQPSNYGIIDKFPDFMIIIDFLEY